MIRLQKSFLKNRVGSTKSWYIIFTLHKRQERQNMLLNAKEILIKEIFYQYLNQLNMICHCEKCMEDVLAISLNQVKPQYITDIDKISYSKSEMVDKQKNTAMLVILTEAASKVSAFPRCENRLLLNKETN